MACECASCKRTAEFNRRLSFVPEEHREYFDDIYEALLNVEMSDDFNSAVLDGSWPNAIDILENAVTKCGYKVVAIDS